MADIELVIKIPEEIYIHLLSRYKYQDTNDIGLSEFAKIGVAIKNGIPLPKGHGRIADMDEAIKCLKDVQGEDAIWAIGLIEWACEKRTIIEADKTESEDT